jgi:hypothetical protein
MIHLAEAFWLHKFIVSAPACFPQVIKAHIKDNNRIVILLKRTT